MKDKINLKAQRRKCCFAHVGWFSLARQRLGADADALEVPGGKRRRGRRAISAEEMRCCEQQADKTGRVIKTGNQRKVCLDCHRESNRCRELEGVAVAQSPSSPCL